MSLTIDINNFKNMLTFMGFTEKDNVFSDLNLSVDFNTSKLIYPVSIRGGRRNNSFAPENIVVFECVHRLLQKGYRPEDIELERQWQLGHDAKGGRADICVDDGKDGTLFIIECKTWGREFDKALTDTKNDGAQLFSYWQQEQSTKWLTLYTSRFKDGKLEYKAPTISCLDDENLILMSEGNTGGKVVKLFRDAKTVQDRYKTWKETYDKKIFDDIIFNPDGIAYRVEIQPLRKRDLKNFNPGDKVVNRFEEILRHNNVSDKENAFNRLIALFICKLVDEHNKQPDSEVEFQYKPGTDNYETLQDRLQKLHKEGMMNFMGEDIFYLEPDYPDKLFQGYKGSNRKHAIAELKNKIRALKFYSNNDFAFKDVHNKQLFFQNGKILVEMVKLFEKYRIVYPSKHQFLGDMFEQLLSKGFKQNEGQFFTPMPIARFIWDCLPIEEIMKQGHPKVIDYACGAGHFLIEAVETLDHFSGSSDNKWAAKYIFGIEKDYRLARVAKISLFMNGAGEGNIIFGDGLENEPEKGIEPEKFDILVANPPYSVKDFKQHLEIKNNQFTLLDTIGLNGSEIEVLFVERIAQLLKPKGIAAVILPSSIMSNESACYTAAREIIIQNFLIRAVVSLGSKTFGATGTNTVILFLERYNEPPKKAALVADIVESIMQDTANIEQSGWEDDAILQAYTAQIGIDMKSYRAFLKQTLSLQDLEETKYFKMYCTARCKKTSGSKQDDSLTSLYRFIKQIEYEKLTVFSFLYGQKTVIVNSPADNKEQVKFLGYDWSNRKGNEGIKIINPGGRLYDDSNRTNNTTPAAAIRRSFIGSDQGQMPEYCSVVCTKDMVDFSTVDFRKAIKIRPDTTEVKLSVYPSETIRNLNVLLRRGLSPIYGDSSVQVIKSGQAKGFYEFDFTKKYYLSSEDIPADRLLQKGDILINSTGVGTAGRVTMFNLEGKFVADNHITVFRTNQNILPKYALYFLSYGIGFKNIENLANGTSGQVELSLETIRNISIPFPPIEVQKQIVSDCEELDNRRKTLLNLIADTDRKVDILFGDVNGHTYKLHEICSLQAERIEGSTILPQQYITTDNMLQKCAGVKEYEAEVPALVTKFRKGDILFSNIRPYLQKLWIATFDGGCSNDVLVFRVKDPKQHNPYIVGSLLKRTSFFDYVMLNVSGIKMPRGNKSHLMQYTFSIPDREVQDRIETELKMFEKQIEEYKKQLEEIEPKIVELLQKRMSTFRGC